MNNEEFEKLKFNFNDTEDLINNSTEFYKLMQNRRTTRDLSNKKIPKEVLYNLIKIASNAPSGANIQPWTFCLVTSDEIKSKIRDESEKIEKLNYEKWFSEQKKFDLQFTGLDYQKEFLTEAPALIVVFKHKYRIENNKSIPNYYPMESVGLAIGMLITAIHYTGLSTIPYTPSPMKFLKKILNRPSYESPVMVLPVAYPKESALVPFITKKKLDEVLVEY